MQLRLEMDALPRLTDMLLFVFIVRHFLCVYQLSKFCLLVESMACGGYKGLFAFGLKIIPAGVEIFTSGKQGFLS